MLWSFLAGALPFNLVFSVEILPIFVVGTKIHSLPRLDCTWNLGKIRWGLFEIFIQMCLALKSLQFSSLYSGTSLWFYIEGSQKYSKLLLDKRLGESHPDILVLILCYGAELCTNV